MNRNVNIKTKNVNSKNLYNEINEFIETGLLTPGISWTSQVHRESFGEVVEEWLEEFKQDDRITQYNVVCDERANPSSQDLNTFRVIVTYKQRHCLNTTSAEYIVTHGNDDMDDLFDWVTMP